MKKEKYKVIRITKAGERIIQSVSFESHDEEEIWALYGEELRFLFRAKEAVEVGGRYQTIGAKLMKGSEILAEQMKS